MISTTFLKSGSKIKMPADELREYYDGGGNPDALDPDFDLPYLHMFIGQNQIDLVKICIDHGATFGPDRFGRWPSTIAAICEVSEEMCDLVVEAEADWLERHGGIPD